MAIDPQIYTGQPSFGYQVDSPLQAYTKYNRHKHTLAAPTNFLIEDIDIGEEVELNGREGNDVFYRPTLGYKVLISEITPTTIVLSSIVTEDITNGTLLVAGNKTVDNISITANTATIIRTSTEAGPVRPELITSALTKTNSLYIPLDIPAPSSDDIAGSYEFTVSSGTLNVSGSDLLGSPELPTIYLYRGKTYSLNFIELAIANTPLYLTTSPNYLINEYPPALDYSVGRVPLLANGLVTAYKFTVPFSAPEELYYICPALNNKAGLIKILDASLANVSWSVGSIQTELEAVIPLGLPDFSVPIIIEAEKDLRLASLTLMPLWANPHSPASFKFRPILTRGTSVTNLLPITQVNTVGKSKYSLPSNLVKAEDSVQILLYETEPVKGIFIELNYFYLS